MNRSWTLGALCVLVVGAGCSDGSSTGPRLDPDGLQFASAKDAGVLGHNNGKVSVLNLEAPAVIAGDVLIAQVVAAKLKGQEKGNGNFICPPAGWQSIRRTNNRSNEETSDIAQETFVLVATAEAPATTYQWKFRKHSCDGGPVKTAGSGAILSFTDVDAANPVDVHAGNNGASSGPFATPSVTTTVDGARVLRFVASRKNTQVAFTGITTLYSISSSAHESRVAAAGEFTQSIAGATGVGSFAFGAQGSADWAGQTIALRPAAPQKRIFIRDTFSRTLAESWGTADIGGEWFENLAGPSFRVDGSTGLVEIPSTAAVHNVVARDLSTYGLDVTGLTSFSIEPAPDVASRTHLLHVYARRNDQVTDGDNYYRYRVRVLGVSNVMDIRLEKNVNGVPTFLSDIVVLPTTFTPGAKYWVRWEAFGTSPATTVRMRVWKDGDAEPAEWQASAVVDEPGLDVPGTSGLRFQPANQQVTWPVRYRIDDFVYAER